jgi:predicted small metal-binding protein
MELYFFNCCDISYKCEFIPSETRDLLKIASHFASLVVAMT